jgi:hypothetical protein
MGSNAFENELLKNINLLSKEQQVKVLAFVRSLLESNLRTSDNKDFLKFAGVFDTQSLKEMSAAINADCGNIDKDEW